MEKNYYYLHRLDTKEDIEAGKNRRDAIRKGRELAAEKKTSIQILKCVEDEGDLVVQYIGILEFPYFLRNCQLDWRDITVNI